MNQLLIYVLQSLFVGIGDKIDTAFGNNISLDALCVLSSYTIITWVSYCCYQIGTYAYRVILSKPKSCFILTIISSFMVSIIVFILSPYIPHIFSLTENQYILFEKCLKVHAISVIWLAIGDFTNNYIMIKCQNKLIWISNIIYYSLMIILDFMVVKLGKDLNYLIACTGISYFVYDLVVIKYSGIFSEGDKISIKDIKEGFMHAKNILIDRLLGKVATIVFNIYASKLGTSAYAIHSVSYSIGTFTEHFTNALFTYQNVKLQAFDNIEEKFLQCKKIMKENYLKLSIGAYITSLILVFIIHGAAPLKHCIIFSMLYCSQVLLIQLYESFRGFLTSARQSQYLRYGGLVGIFVRIPIALISYYTPIGIYGFAFASGIDFGVRGIYYYICAVKVKNKSIKKQ